LADLARWPCSSLSSGTPTVLTTPFRPSATSS
jgi:hypothetical protein